jgi:hypothetical protein
MTFNSTSKILSFIDPNTGLNGVILPQSSRILFESDIDTKIKKVRSHIDHLSNAQSHRKTHGGKRFCARQISLQNQIQHASRRLALLASAKIIIESGRGLNKEVPASNHLTQSHERMTKEEMAAPVAAAGAGEAVPGDGSRPAAAAVAQAQIASTAARKVLNYSEIKSAFANLVKTHTTENLSKAIRQFAITLDDQCTLFELEQILKEVNSNEKAPLKVNFEVREGRNFSLDAFLDVTDFISCVIERKKSRPLPYLEIASRFARAETLSELEDLASLVDKTHTLSSLQQLIKETEAHRASDPKKNFKIEESHDGDTKIVDLSINLADFLRRLIENNESSIKLADAITTAAAPAEVRLTAATEQSASAAVKKALPYSEIAFLFSTAVTLSDLDDLGSTLVSQCTSFELEQLLEKAKDNKKTTPRKQYKIWDKLPDNKGFFTSPYGMDLTDIISRASSLKTAIATQTSLKL